MLCTVLILPFSILKILSCLEFHSCFENLLIISVREFVFNLFVENHEGWRENYLEQKNNKIEITRAGLKFFSNSWV